MGGLALHLAKVARRRHPRHAVPEEVNGYFAEMGRVAVELGNSAREVLLSQDPREAARIDEEDDAMDELHQRLFGVVMDRQWPAEDNLLHQKDLDSYALRLAFRLQDAGLVSVWCTKRHSEHSFVRIETAREVPPPPKDVLIAEPTASHARSDHLYHQQIQAAVAGVAQLPAVQHRVGVPTGRRPARRQLALRCRRQTPVAEPDPRRQPYSMSQAQVRC
jgi:hypothetical protein